MVLSKSPSIGLKQSNLNWVHGFHRGLEAFAGFAYYLCFCKFGGGRPKVLSKCPPKNPPNSNLNLVDGFHRVLEVLFEMLLMISFVVAFLEGGGPWYLASFPRTVQETKI